MAFDGLYDKLVEHNEEIETVVADSAYNTPYIAKKLTDDKKDILVPYRRPMTKKGFFKKYEFAYDEFYDCVICPENQVLKYATTNRDGYREFKSNPKICENCPSREKCTESKNCGKEL